MTNRKFYMGAIAAAVIAALPIANAWSASTRAEAEDAIAAAEEARKKAASVGGEWRDTGKMIKQATSLLDTREYTKAIGIAEKAKQQGELGYEQAMGQKDAGLPSYMIATAAKAKETAPSADPAENMITAELAVVEVMHDGNKLTITRGHDRDAILPAEFAKTERGCPPFCVQPMQTADGVATVGEVEVLSYLQEAAQGDDSVLVIDSRTPDWVMRGTIPGSVNIPWTAINADQAGMFGDRDDHPLEVLLEEKFGAKQAEGGGWDFSDAKTLVLFCNGLWCGQSSANIATLLDMGYPAEKLKWYRGGMQDWVSVGLTTVKP
jgi:rhodanese-related sulfurtransferase